jgi:hypothetical protein
MIEVSTDIADRQRFSSTSCVIAIYERLLADVSELSGVHLCTPDEITNEWVLKAGPKLDKDLLSYLEGSGGLPEFPEWLKPLLERFLSSMDGKYLKFIRQVLLFCYKIEFEPTNDQLKEAQATFENTDADIANWDEAFASSPYSPYFAFARQIVGKCIYKIDWRRILPGHGPGAVYPSCHSYDKSKFLTIYRPIESFYPHADYMCGIPSFWWDHYVKHADSLIEEDTIVSRLVAVPKDSRGPRLICVHPKESVWIQQGCRRLLEHAIMSPYSPCHGRITFNDQTVNGRLALASSIDREYCTLDLKEASDRISCSLVKYLFGDFAYEWISCSRASQVKLLDGRVITLRKWAPMGNALTFPVQSLVFYALVRAGIRSHYGENCSDIFVFGDDIVFPTKYYDGAVRALVRSGAIPNTTKTFRHGFFRESCGVDAFKGINVTPHRLRRLDTETVAGAASLSTLACALVRSGYRSTADWIYRRLSRDWGRLHISNNPDSQGIFRYESCGLDTLLKYEDSVRFNTDLHRWETKLLLVKGATIRPPNDAWWHLQDSLLALSRKGNSDVESSGLAYTVPHRARLQRGWSVVV